MLVQGMYDILQQVRRSYHTTGLWLLATVVHLRSDHSVRSACKKPRKSMEDMNQSYWNLMRRRSP